MIVHTLDDIAGPLLIVVEFYQKVKGQGRGHENKFFQKKLQIFYSLVLIVVKLCEIVVLGYAHN